jgi:hypothetical protein
MRSEDFMVVKIYIVVIWVVTLCNHIDCYQSFGRTCSSIFRVEVNKAEVWVGYIGRVEGLGQGEPDWPIRIRNGEEEIKHCLGQ